MLRSLKILLVGAFYDATLSFNIINFYVKRVKYIVNIVILLKFAVDIKFNYATAPIYASSLNNVQVCCQRLFLITLCPTTTYIDIK